MPRKPKAERKQIHVELDGGIVDVKMFPPEPVRNRKAWYAYWKGLKARKTTGETDYDKAVQAVAVMLHNGGEKPCCDEDHLLTDEEFIEIQRRHFSKKTDPASKKRAESSLTNALEAIDSFRRVSGLNPISRATPDDCERFQTEALKLPRNWRSQHPKSKPEKRTIRAGTVHKWLVALQAAFERANDNGGRKCVRGVVKPERLLKSNPWKRFTWIEPPKKKILQFEAEELLKLLQYFQKKWPGVTAAEAMMKIYVWSWARREEVAALKWEDLRIVGDELHFDTVGKWGVEKWFRIPRTIYDELLALRTDSPFVFGKLNDQIREFHRSEGRTTAAKMVRDFDVYNTGRWFYEAVKKWSGGTACVHMLRKTVLQYARVGEDAARSLAKDAGVSEAVMMTHYVKEEDPQFRAASNAMFERLCLSMTPEVASAFGHVPTATTGLEQRMQEATRARNWPLVGELAKKLAQQDRQAG